MEIEFDFLTEGDELPDAFMSSYELDMMFDHTRKSIRSGAIPLMTKTGEESDTSALIDTSSGS